MKIGLDFDDTYTLDPTFWNRFIKLAQESGHDVRITTFRKSTMTDPALTWIGDYMCNIIYTEYKGKRNYCRDVVGWEPDVWIDDSPEFIVIE